MIRVVVPVGIAYGSETDKARRLLLEVAAADDRVLDEPEPSCLFMGFGESSLDFELRVFVGGLRDYFEARSGLHMAIDQAFRKAHIEIAFPQRDLHLRTVSAALPVEARQVEQIMRQNGEGAGEQPGR